MKKSIKYYAGILVFNATIWALLGVLLLLGVEPQWLKYVFIGVFLFLTVELALMLRLINKKLKKENPEIMKQHEIEAKDERNIIIKGKVCEVIVGVNTYLLAALMAVFAALQARTEADFEAVLWVVMGIGVVNGITMFAAMVYFKKKM
jgi:small basic protein